MEVFKRKNMLIFSYITWFSVFPKTLLRGSTGGYLSQVVLVASLFIDGGNVVAKIVSLDDFTNVYRAIGNDYKKANIAILIDKNTAAGSEILAEAIRINTDAKIFGQKSYGRNTIQTLFQLSDGSELWITTAEFYTADDKPLSKNGVTPDVLVSEDSLPLFSETEKSHLNDYYQEEVFIERNVDKTLENAIEYLIN